MACEFIGPNIIVCGPPRGVYRRQILMCHETCKRRTRHVIRYMGMYYGYDTTCLRCGDEMQDGCPSRPGWREESKSRAHKAWAEALTPREFRARVREIERPYFEDWAQEAAS